MKLGVLQIHVDGGDKRGNEARALSAIESAAAQGAELVVLPELWNIGYFAFDSYEAASEPLHGPTLSKMRDVAQDHDIALLAGSIVENLAETRAETPAKRGLANTSVLIGRNGKRLATYRKQHLFGYESEESALLTPGDRLETAEVAGFTVGITTCYDLRFPELYRKLVDKGVSLVLVPSAWPYPRIEHWTTLTRARAIENQFYVAAVNGVGPAGGPGLIGRSRVIDPWGTPLRALGAEPGTAVVSLEPEAVEDIRNRFPSLEDRRP